MAQLTLEDLLRILREGAGASAAPFDGDISEARFADLGYDSLALLETGTRIERQYGIRLDDGAVTMAETPANLLAVVNDALAQRV
jgi:act minimal PKS acyl carrier protein